MPPGNEQRLVMSLTSVCLRRGATAVPGRYRSELEPGVLRAVDSEGETYEFTLESTFVLSGLAPFAARHDLHPNDEIVLFPIGESGRYRIEAHKRARRAAPPPPQGTAAGSPSAPQADRQAQRPASTDAAKDTAKDAARDSAWSARRKLPKLSLEEIIALYVQDDGAGEGSGDAAAARIETRELTRRPLAPGAQESTSGERPDSGHSDGGHRDNGHRDSGHRDGRSVGRASARGESSSESSSEERPDAGASTRPDRTEGRTSEPALDDAPDVPPIRYEREAHAVHDDAPEPPRVAPDRPESTGLEPDRVGPTQDETPRAGAPSSLRAPERPGEPDEGQRADEDARPLRVEREPFRPATQRRFGWTEAPSSNGTTPRNGSGSDEESFGRSFRGSFRDPAEGESLQGEPEWTETFTRPGGTSGTQPHDDAGTALRERVAEYLLRPRTPLIVRTENIADELREPRERIEALLKEGSVSPRLELSRLHAGVYRVARVKIEEDATRSR